LYTSAFFIFHAGTKHARLREAKSSSALSIILVPALYAD